MTTPQARRGAGAVPTFFLYGEPRRMVSPRFLHLEALEKRSRPRDWTIRPHAHAELHHLFVIATGSGRMEADGLSTRFDAPCLLAVPARTVHGFAWAPETQGHVLTLAEGYLNDLRAREPAFAGLFKRAACLVGEAAGGLGGHLALLDRELAWSAPGAAAAVEACLLMILVDALRLRAQSGGQADPEPGRAAGLVARFRAAVEAEFRAGLSVEDHAARLGVTAALLRRACAQSAGCPPARIIHDRLFLEAQRVLLYTNMTVSEAANHLGFADHAYFTRFFTRRAGVPPGRFRRGGD